MTRPTKSPANVESINAPESPNNAPEPAPTAQTHRDDQQSAWLHAGPEGFHAPVTQSRPAQIIGLSALAVVVAGLAVATMVHVLTQDSRNRPGSEQITAPLTTAPARVRSTPSDVPTANAPPTTRPAPVPTTVAPATSPETPLSPETPVMTPAAPKPPEPVPVVGAAERRANTRREPLASPRPPAPPGITATEQPSGADKDQTSAAQPAATAPPCATNCTEPTLTRTPTSWTPERP